MDTSFIKRMLPLIDDAAEAARERAKQVIVNGHLLWQVYVQEKYRLVEDAARVGRGEPTRSGESMTEEEFEAYLLNRGVWVDFDLTDRDL